MLRIINQHNDKKIDKTHVPNLLSCFQTVIIQMTANTHMEEENKTTVISHMDDLHTCNTH